MLPHKLSPLNLLYDSESNMQDHNRHTQQNFKIMKSSSSYIIIFFLSLLFGCKSIEMTSYWRDRDIKIDGIGNDWEGKTWMIKDLKNVSFGFMNDENNLYLSIATSDRALQRQITFRGLTIWFDRNGGEEKKFGVHHPLSMGMRDMPMERRRIMQERDGERDSLPAFSEQFSNELDVFGPMQDEHHRMTMEETGGIDIALHLSKGVLVYEMKIPLQDKGSQPFVIGTAAGSIIGVGIETVDAGMEREKGERPMFVGNPGGGFGGRRGGIAGGGAPPGGMRESIEPLKLWAKVHLAVADSAAAR